MPSYDLENACFNVKKARQIKNKPNAFFKNADGKYAASVAPSAEKPSAGKIIHQIPFVCTSPLSKCVFSAPTLIGRKAKRLAHCAIFCGTPPTSVKSGMVTVPPPMPIPAGIPPKKPSSKYK